MGATTGIAPLLNYATGANDAARIQMLIDLIPDPDTLSSTGAVAGANGSPVGANFLDEMSPAAAVQLRVELAALKAAVS